MTSNQVQIIISGGVATISQILGRIADAPPALQNQIPQMFPEAIRGYVAMIFQTLSGIAFVYALFFAHKPATPSAAVSPDIEKKSDLNPTTPVITAFLIAGMFLSGCAGTADFLESPTNARILAIASNAGAASITSALGTKVTPNQQVIIQDAAGAAINTASTGAVWFFAEWLRTKQGTPQAAKAGIIAAGGVPVNVAKAVPALVATGVPPDVANEAIAMTAQAVAANR